MPSPSPLRNPGLRTLLIVTLTVGAIGFSLPWQWLVSAENLTVDLRYQARGPTSHEPASLIVGVADSSFTVAERAPAVARQEPALAAMSAPWPWDRGVFAAAVRKLRAAGARAVVFDLVLAAETAGDAEFARAIAEPGAPVVFATWLDEARSAVGENTVTLVEPREAFLAANGGRAGYANVWPDDDGVLRQLTLSLRPEDLLSAESSSRPGPAHPSLAFAALQAVSPAAAGRQESGFIDYLGPAGTLPTVPIEDLFLPDRWNGAWLKSGGLFRDRVVWIGPLSEIRFKDYHATPLRRMAGVEAHAQAFETLARVHVLRPVSWPVTIALVWVLAIAGALATGACRRVPVVLLGGGILAWAALAMVLFTYPGIVLPVVAPLGGFLVAGAGGVAARFIAEQRERQRLRGMLARYVSEQVARVILGQPEEFSASLRGRRRAVAVLFADLRGFTGWVERAEPEALVAQLNEYFHAVVDCVLAHGGTLQKFIGDAVLAVWGDTGSAGAAADAAHALDAALAIERAVTRLNAEWAGRADRTPVAIGLGLHHGIAMVGNVGHPQRMEFTVLGDVVNVAARLETANRQLGTTLLATAAIRDLTLETHRHAELGRFAVKGRRESIAVYAPLGRIEAEAPGWLGDLGNALAAWSSGDFPGAAAGYAALAAQPTPLADFFRLRAQLAHDYLSAPPSAWDGVHVLETK